jgi:ATP-dependent Clp protease ATP-binding subunit ClpB
MTTTLPYAPELKRAIQIAAAIAKEHQHPNFGPAHLLKAVLHNDIGLGTLLASWDKDIHYLREWADIRIETAPKSTVLMGDSTADTKALGTLEVADMVRLKLQEDTISPIAVLIAITKPNVAFTSDQLKTIGLTEKELLENLLNEVGLQNSVAKPAASNGKSGGSAAPKNAAANALLKYCTDKTALAKEGKIDPIIGRDRETRQMMEVLGRRTKPNVIIVGEPGVGKTALVDGFALAISEGKTPPMLQNGLLFELDYGSLVAGASYKGEVEDRLKSILAETKQFEKAILFIDEIHQLLDPQGGSPGAGNLLKPELARGEVTVIGATTNEEYRQYIEADAAFNRRFEVIRVGEPDEQTAIRMVKALAPSYEKHHGLQLEPQAMVEAVRFAKRYIKDRRLPDAAIDLVDRTMASIKMMGETTAKDLANLTKELEELTKTIEKDDIPTQLNELFWFNNQMQARLSPILLGQIEDETRIESFDSPVAATDSLKKTLATLGKLSEKKRDSVGPADIAALVAYKTGIPMGKIQSKEKEKLLLMEDQLQKRVVGQDHGIKVLAEAVREARSGLTKAGQPIGSFFLLGPTGTGKTEIAKALAEFLFNDEKAMIRFDMSEFKEEHSAALLYGAPPGYIGYKEGGLLVNKIRQQPFSVVLFDEIEKAHASVFDIFLQIMDDGKLSDKLGKEGDFSNAIILFTSNIGSKMIVEQFDKGETPKSDELMEIMQKHFRPEFLGRVTEIIPFRPITKENIVKIFNIQLKSLHESLDKQGISLRLDEPAREQLALAGFNPQYGARPIRGVIRNQLRRPISRLIISGQVKKGDEIFVKADSNESVALEINTK